MGKLKVEVDLNNLTEDDKKFFLALIEKGKFPRKWSPRKNEDYYSIDEDGYIRQLTNYEYIGDSMRLKIGNFFRTRGEAEFEVERRKIITQLEKLSIESGEQDNPWDDHHVHYYIGASFDLNGKLREVSAFVNKSCVCEGTFFATEKSCIDAINEIGKENIVKYILKLQEN